MFLQYFINTWWYVVIMTMDTVDSTLMVHHGNTYVANYWGTNNDRAYLSRLKTPVSAESCAWWNAVASYQCNA